MIDSIIKDRCTGCEGCASVCPTKCIDMGKKRSYL